MLRAAVLVALATSLSTGCKSSDSADNKADAKAERPPIKVRPHAPVEAREEKGEMAAPVKTAKGFVDAMVDGNMVHFQHLPFGQNAAIVLEDKDHARTTVFAKKGTIGFPAIEVQINEFRIDKLDLPATLTVNKRKDGKEQSIRLRYHQNKTLVFESDPKETAAGTNKVVIEAFDGKTIRGSFEGTVHTKKPAPKSYKIERGKFEVTLRTKGMPRADAKAGG